MKKLILIFSAVVCALMASSQGWVEPTDQAYDKEHVVYATIDGMTANDDYVVGAFIDGECRAAESVKLDANGSPSQPLRYELRVKGGTTDAGRSITFKVYDVATNCTYTLGQTLAYIPEGTTGQPSDLYKLNFVKATSYAFVETSVDLYIGSTYDIEYTPVPEDSQLPDGFDEMFVVNQNLQAVSISGKTVTGLQIGSAYVFNNALRANNGELVINVVDQPIAVESISINNELSTLIYVGDEIVLNPYFSINPANASNKAVTVTSNSNNVSISESPVAAGTYILNANATGTAVVTITSVENANISTQITFNVKQHVEYLGMNQMANFTLSVGQIVNLADYYIISPDDAYNKAVEVSVIGEAASVSGSGENWTLAANQAGVAEVTVISVDNPQLQTTLYFQIVQLAQRITVSPNTFDIAVGETINCGTQMQVTIFPAEADQSYTLSTDNSDIVEVHDAAVTAATIVGLAKGSATVTVTAADGSGVSTTVTVNVHPALVGFSVSDNEVTISSRANKVITITPNPTDAIVNDELTFSITGPNLPGGWKYVDGSLNENGNGGYDLALTPYCMGEGTLNISYGNGAIAIPAIPLHIGFEYNLEAGWNWISTFSDGVSPASQTMGQILGDKLVEARTQDGLLYNDPTYGYFGDFTDFDNADKFYKVKSKSAVTYMLFGSYNSAASVDLRKGWNWIPYTCEYDQNISLAGQDGDVILSLTDGLATYTDGAWAPADFSLKAGQGYLYYSDNVRVMQLPDPYSCEQRANTPANAPALARSYWTYNPHVHNSIMPVIAVIDGFDTDNYTVGAFVGDECRGAGRLVDGKWFITVAGEEGEEVSFRIYDRYTGETTDVDTTVMMTSIIGSAKAPVALEANGCGVSSIRAIDVDGNASSECYDLFGRPVCNPTNGIYIINGKKVIVK